MPTLATVRYLNARPLDDRIERQPDVELVRHVPSRLLATLESGGADLALCPVIDFQRAATPLEIVPAGAIGCDGPAMTVKVFSRRPVAAIDTIAVDRESHTSVALLQVVMRDLFGREPELRPLSDATDPGAADAVLLIGDKVVTAPPDRASYPYGLDLGAAWRELTGRPFVFATWMAPAGRDLGTVPLRLDELRRRNRKRLARIVAEHAAASGWPEPLALQYLSRNLRFDIGARELAAVAEFWRRCHEVGVIDEVRPMRLYGGEE